MPARKPKTRRFPKNLSTNRFEMIHTPSRRYTLSAAFSRPAPSSGRTTSREYALCCLCRRHRNFPSEDVRPLHPCTRNKTPCVCHYLPGQSSRDSPPLRIKRSRKHPANVRVSNPPDWELHGSWILSRKPLRGRPTKFEDPTLYTA